MGSVTNLNAPRLDDGRPLTAAELAEYNAQREAATCCEANGTRSCDQGRQCPHRMAAEACTDIGSEMHREPVSRWAVEMAIAVCLAAGLGVVQAFRWAMGWL